MQILGGLNEVVILSLLDFEVGAAQELSRVGVRRM